jgi:hypothetical protein
MKEARPASPPVVTVEAAPTHRFLPLLYHVIFFLTHVSFCKIFRCNLTRYYICLPYCCYTCDLNILGRHIEASVSSSRNRGGTISPQQKPSSPLLSRWLELVIRRWAEVVLICYCGHFHRIRWRDRGAKGSMISIGNHMVVPTM